MKTLLHKFLSLLVTGSLLISCEDPEPYFNKNAVPPEEFELNLFEIKDGQYLAGQFYFCYEPEIPFSQISSVALFVDDQLTYSVDAPVWGAACYMLFLDTEQWSQEIHDVSVGIYLKNPPDHGLLGLAFLPSIMYTASVVFDQTPPTAVTLQSVVLDQNTKSPKLSWSKNADLNFYAYIIYREEQLGGIFVDTIYDQNITSFIDDSDEVIGIHSTYKIIVWNRASLVESNGVEFKYPESVPVTVDQFIGVYPPIESADGTELFVMDSEGVKAIAKASNTIVRVYEMTYKFPQGFALSKDGSKLYILSSYSPNISVIDAETFDLISANDIQGLNGKHIVCGRSDRLYISTTWPGNLTIMDAELLEVIKVLDIQAPNGLLEISSDNNTLYVADPSNSYQQAVIYSIDVSSDDPTILNQKTASDEIRDIELSADDETLFVIHDYDYPEPMNQFVDCWTASSLTSYQKLNVPNQAFKMSINATSLCVVYGERYLNNWSPGGIRLYDLSTGSVVHEWKIKQAPYECFIDSGNDNLYTFGFDSWVIRLNNFIP